MEDRTVWRLRRQGHNFRQIANITGLPEDEVRKTLLGDRKGAFHADPNELLIQLVTSAIQLTWTESERQARRSVATFRVDRCDPVSATPPRPSRN